MLVPFGLARSGNIASGAIGWPHLASGASRSGHIGDQAVNSGNVASGSLDWSHFRSGLVSGLILSEQIGSGQVRFGHMGSGSVGSWAIGSGVVAGALWAIPGTLPSHIIPGSIGGTDLASGGVWANGIGSGAVKSGNYASGSIDWSHLRSGLVSGLILTGQIGSGQVAPIQITQPAVFGGTTALLAFGADPHWSLSMAAGAIPYSQVGSGPAWVDIGTSGHVLTAASGPVWGQVGPAGIASGAVVSGKLANASVNSGNYASGSIGIVHLASGTTALTSGSIRSGMLGDGSVTSGSYASGSTGWAHLASGILQAIPWGYPGKILGNAEVRTSQNTTSATPVELATSLTFDVTTATIANLVVMCSCNCISSLTDQTGRVYVQEGTVASGTTTVVSLNTVNPATGGASLCGNLRLSGVAAGTYTFIQKYSITGGATGSFSTRYMEVRQVN